MALKKRGLNRGLDALLGETKAEPTEKRGTKPQEIPIEWLQRGKYQPRKDIDPEKIKELADSIKSQGIIQPIVVRLVDFEKYEIVAGERRWRAAQMAGMHEVPVIIKDIDDRSAMAIALIENIQREDLNPLEESEALKRLVDEFELTHQQIADSVGKSRATVTNLLRLIDLHPEVKKMLISKSIEMGHARALLSLEGSLQVEAAKKISNLNLTVRAAEKLVKELLNPPAKKATKPVDHDTSRLEDNLTARLGAKVSINHKQNGAGKIVVSYSSLDQLDGIIERLAPNIE